MLPIIEIGLLMICGPGGMIVMLQLLYITLLVPTCGFIPEESGKPGPRCILIVFALS